MDQNQKNGIDMESLFAAWMKSAADLWGNIPKIQPDAFGAFGKPDEKSQKGAAYQAQRAFETGSKILRAVGLMLSEPDNLNALFKGTDTLPEFMMNISQQVWDGYFELHKRWTEHAARIGQQTKAYNFENIDQNIFKAAGEIYEKEYRKFLNIPQVGLNRFYQERINRLTDNFTMFQTSLGEFVYMFYVPIEKSFGVMQEKLEQMAESGEIHDNFKDYYNMWIKVLEGHYMKLLQSPEYTEVMNKTINALIKYKQAKDEVMYDVLQKLPIPTNKDMDELYKDFYNLKKKVKELSKRIEELENV